MKTVAAAVLALAVFAGTGLAQEPVTPSDDGGHRYLAEIVDSIFAVGPAEFFALDLPADPEGARAIHLSGTVSVADRKGDIMVRLFRVADYQNWLKKKGGQKGSPFWTSKRSRSITLDHDLPLDSRVVVLLDNGYSVRTPKRVRTQLQLQYEQIGAPAASAAAPVGEATPADDLVVPRSNTEENIPPPPPPPDEGTP